MKKEGAKIEEKIKKLRNVKATQSLSLSKIECTILHVQSSSFKLNMG